MSLENTNALAGVSSDDNVASSIFETSISDIEGVSDTTSQHTEDYIAIDDECTLCMDRMRTHAFIPCGHFAVCEACADLCKQQTPLVCLQCCQPAIGVFRIFRS